MLSQSAGSHLPARILLYQENISALASDEDRLFLEIGRTLRHELAHHFGFSEADIRERWPEGA